MARSAAEAIQGPIFIGFFFNVLLYGIMLTQVFLYYTKYKQDRLWMKLFVLLLLVLDTINVVFDFVYIYEVLITNFMNLDFLVTANWLFATDQATTGLIGGLVQLFFAWRVMVLTRKWWIVAIIATCALADAAAGIATCIQVAIHTTTFFNLRVFQPVVIVWLTSAAVADVLITITLVWHLRKHKTGFKGTDAIIDKIMRLTVQAGTVTAVVAVVDLIFFLVDPSGNHLIFNYPLSKLYTNSLMSTLNSRNAWKASTSKGQDQLSYGNPENAVQRLPADNPILSLGGGRPEVFIHVESHEMRDVEGKATDSKADSLEDYPQTKGSYGGGPRYVAR